MFNLNSDVCGHISEKVALDYLNVNVPGKWELTERYSYADRCGVDAIGVLATGEMMFVQIKSSFKYAIAWAEFRARRYEGQRIECLIVPSDSNCADDIDWL